MNNQDKPSAGRKSLRRNNGEIVNGRYVTERENFQRLLENKQPYWVPRSADVIENVGDGIINENGIQGIGGKDAYGVTWIATVSADGMTTPHPTEHLMESITQWREVYRPVDLDALDWEGVAAQAEKTLDRTQRMVAFPIREGLFQRLMSFMGFENVLCDMMTEEEECAAFFEALADEHIAIIRRAARHFKPDILTYYDDVAHLSSVFMSPELFRRLIKPQYQRIYDAARECGMLVNHHCCGKCDAIVGDFVDVGARMWNPAEESCNDLPGIREKYGDRLILIGGFNTRGQFLYDEENRDALVREAVHHSIKKYAPGGGYVFDALVMEFVRYPEKMAILDSAYQELRGEIYKTG